jgi:hypothetical protein
LTTIDVFKQNYAHCFKRVTFSCENVISIKDSINPTIYHVHPLSNSKDLRVSEEKEGLTIESGWTECVEAKRLRDAFPHRGELLAIR